MLEAEQTALVNQLLARPPLGITEQLGRAQRTRWVARQVRLEPAEPAWPVQMRAVTAQQVDLFHRLRHLLGYRLTIIRSGSRLYLALWLTVGPAERAAAMEAGTEVQRVGAVDRAEPEVLVL